MWHKILSILYIVLYIHTYNSFFYSSKKNMMKRLFECWKTPLSRCVTILNVWLSLSHCVLYTYIDFCQTERKVPGFTQEFLNGVLQKEVPGEINFTESLLRMSGEDGAGNQMMCFLPQIYSRGNLFSLWYLYIP